MKRLACIFLLVTLFACQQKEPSGEKDVTVFGVKVGEDTAKTQDARVGADTDLHGCKTSAGYTWSELKKECVRLFETGTQLKPYNDPTGAQMGAFVIFDGDKAEIFAQTEKPFIATRPSEGEPFIYGDWQLIPWKGYLLKKKGTILYTGDNP